jgi:hypothetical protein
MVVHRHGQHALGVFLANDIVLEDTADLFRRGNAVAGLDQRGFVLLADDVHAEFDAFITDEYRRTGNELPDFMLALTAEGAIECILGVSAAANFRHFGSPGLFPDHCKSRSIIVAVNAFLCWRYHHPQTRVQCQTPSFLPPTGFARRVTRTQHRCLRITKAETYTITLSTLRSIIG